MMGRMYDPNLLSACARAGGLRIDAPAKLNLSLDILGKRDDGFHEVVTVVCRVDLLDELIVRRRGRPGVQLSCSQPGVPTDASNLAARGAQAVLEAIGADWGVEIELRKAIPAGAGLGGGSSDAASAMLATMALSGTPLPCEQLAELGGRIGSDVPLFLYPGVMRAVGRGERIAEQLPAPPLGARLLLPALHVDTASIFAALARAGGGSGSDDASDRVWRALRAEDRAALLPALANDLEPAAFAALPQLEALFTRLAARLPGLRMSGSGSALYQLTSAAPPPALAPLLRLPGLPPVRQRWVQLLDAIPTPRPLG